MDDLNAKAAKSSDEVPPYDGIVNDASVTNGAPTSIVRPQHRKLHDSSVTFEEYHYYALRTRAEEDATVGTPVAEKTGIISQVLRRKAASSPEAEKQALGAGEKNVADPRARLEISDEEWSNASRMLRSANAAACFYLITTDILGVSCHPSPISFTIVAFPAPTFYKYFCIDSLRL